MATQKWSLFGTLTTLHETCRDAENIYRLAAQHAQSPDLQALFRDYADRRARFAAELRDQVTRLGLPEEKEGTLTGALRQAWDRVKSAVAGWTDKALVSECEQAEDAEKAAYEEALKQDLPADVRAVVERQYAAVREAHDRVRALEVATQ